MGKTIEIFTDSSLYGEDLVERVKKHACPRCSLLVYDAGAPENREEMQTKMKAYGAASLPAVVFDGRLIDPQKLGQGKFKDLLQHMMKT